MGDVPLVPQGDVLEADQRVRPHDARQAADRSAVIGLRLCGIADEPFWARAEVLLHLADLGALQMAHLERDALERRRQQRERRQHLGVAVALEHLRATRRRLKAESLARCERSTSGSMCAKRADGARKLAHAQPLERAEEALAVPVEPEAPTQPA